MLWFDRKGLFREFKRRVRVTRIKALFENAAHTDKAGTIIGQEALVRFFGFAFVTRGLCRLRRQKVGQLGLAQILLGLCRFRHRHTTLARCESKHSVRQGLKAFALAVAVKIPR